jgi:preprotein translocase subunit SecY
MTAHAPRCARTRVVTRLLIAAAGLSALFWAAVLSGKLNIQSHMNALPVIPGPALLLLLVVTLVLFLAACLVEEARVRVDSHTENTKGDL